MLNIFQLADNDQSVYYLGQIFGNVSIGLAGTGPALLGNMFKVFNTTLLALGAIIITYTTVVGVIKTAHEGKFLGEHWSGLWVPIRTLIGVVALFPTKTGYCAMQVAFMWFIVQGVGVADMVWKSTVTYLSNKGAIQTPAPPADVVNQVPNMMKQIFADAVCQAAVTKLANNDMKVVAHSVAFASNSATGGGGIAFGRSGVNDLTQKECGTVTWGSKDPAMSAAQGQALQSIVPVMESLADSYVTSVLSDANCWNVGTCTPEQPQGCMFKKYQNWYAAAPNYNSCSVNNATANWNNLLAFAGSNFILESVKLFTGYANNYSVNDALRRSSNVPGTSIANLSDAMYKKSSANGWVFAGAFYYYIANQNNGVSADYFTFLNGIKVNQDSNPENQICSGNVCDLMYQFNNPKSYGVDLNQNTYSCGAVAALYCGGPPDQYVKKGGTCPDVGPGSPIICQPNRNKGALGVGDQAISAMTNASSVGGGISVQSAGPSDSNPVIAFIEGIQSNIFQSFTSAIAPQGDSQANPVVTMQSFGHTLLVMADNVFLAVIALALVLGGLSTIVTVFGTTVNYAQGVTAALLAFLLPLAAAILGYMISVGAMLGVYMPLVPYVLFTFGAIGWFIAVIEAMIAAPLVALSILAPGGQEVLGSKAEGAIFMLLNVFLRPSLMVFGMMAGMLLSYIVVKFINAAFYTVLTQMTGGTLGLIEGFLFLMAYAGLIMTAINKCFSLIHVIPERAITWIGGHGVSYGEAEAAQEVMGKIMAGAGEVSEVGRAAGASGARAAGKLAYEGSAAGREEAAKRKDRADAAKPEADQTAQGGIGARAADDEKK